MIADNAQFFNSCRKTADLANQIFASEKHQTAWQLIQRLDC